MRIRKQALGTRNMVGAKIEAKRKELGMTQRQLAEKLCMSDKSVSKWERVNDYELVAIADVLGVSINWLVGKE